MADIDNILSKHSDNYRFHGVRSATLSHLVAQSENGQIVLWGRNSESETSEYLQGEGELSVTDISDIEMSFNEFCDESGLVLVLEKIVAEPIEVEHESDDREHLVRVEEWKVVGGLRPVFDEDGDVVDQEAFSLEEIIAEF
jgi:hypothetical protein